MNTNSFIGPLLECKRKKVRVEVASLIAKVIKFLANEEKDYLLDKVEEEAKSESKENNTAMESKEALIGPLLNNQIDKFKAVSAGFVANFLTEVIKDARRNKLRHEEYYRCVILCIHNCNPNPFFIHPNPNPNILLFIILVFYLI